MNYKKEAELTLSGFYELQKGIIDTSFIIYMGKAGYLNIAASQIEFFAPEQVFNEADIKPGKIRLIDAYRDERISTDELILKQAFSLNIPVISDDKKVLKGAASLNINYFNSLMILSYIFWRGVIDHNEYKALLSNLKLIARYSGKIYEYGEAVEKTILNTQNRK